MTGIRSSGFDSANLYKFKVENGLFPFLERLEKICFKTTNGLRIRHRHCLSGLVVTKWR
jgi:hypothetical protein